ncbi:MAG: insulinase family protein [Bacteroidetes bacterium]|nr:insulinase family protein [Bacteroidota bacterium]
MNNIKNTRLDNGLRVVSESLPHVNSFSLGFWVNVGSIHESAKNNGITHFIEHMVFKGTRSRSAKKISEDVESLGGYLNAFTSKEHTCFYGRGLSQHLEKTFEVIADLLSNPRFDEKDIINEAGVVVDELYDIEDSPEEVIFDRFESGIYSGLSLSYPIIGTEKNIRKFNQKELFEFVKKNYTSDNIVIVASGKIDHSLLVSLAEKYLKIPEKRFCTNEKIAKPAKAKNVFIEKDIQQTHIVAGIVAPGIKNKRRIAVGLLSHILGEGSSSRLFQSLREKNGIAYQINSFFNSFYDISSLGIYFSTSDLQVPKGLQIIERELCKLREKSVLAKELNRTKEYIKGNLLMSLESTTNRMMRMGNSILYYDRIKSTEESISQVDNVTIDEISLEAKRLLDFDKMNIVAMGSNNAPFSSIIN